MADNVVALPNFSVPSDEPVQKVIDLLQEALDKAKMGKTIGVAIVSAERDPECFVMTYHATQGSRHSLAAGVMAINYAIGKVLAED